MTVTTTPFDGSINGKFRKDFSNTGSTSSRIPESLLNVFLKANRGFEVNEPPKDNTAFKVFQRRQQQPASIIWLPDIKSGVDTPGWSTRFRSSFHNSNPTGSNDDRHHKKLSRRASAKLDELASCASLQRSVLPKKTATSHEKSPQHFLDVIMLTHGYSTDKFNTMETSYYNEITAMQISSFHCRLLGLVQSQDEVKLREIMACGISTNPCNRHGDSVLHIACRSGWDTSVRVLLECGATVQVSDGAGRTPLHSAFSGTKPSYELIELLIQQDRNLLQLRDKHGATPLSYIPRDQWGIWIDFFYSKRDQFWPRRDRRFDGVAKPPTQTQEKPNSRPLSDPPEALTPEMAGMVASGKLTPAEARCLMEDDNTSCSEEAFLVRSCHGHSIHGDSTYTDSMGRSQRSHVSFHEDLDELDKFVH